MVVVVEDAVWLPGLPPATLEVDPGVVNDAVVVGVQQDGAEGNCKKSKINKYWWLLINVLGRKKIRSWQFVYCASSEPRFSDFFYDGFFSFFFFLFFFLVWRDLGVSLKGRISRALSNHIGFRPRLLYSSTHHSPESFIPIKTDWAQHAWLQWSHENWYFHLDISRWLGIFGLYYRISCLVLGEKFPILGPGGWCHHGNNSSLKSSIFSSTNSQLDKTFWGVVSGTVEQCDCSETREIWLRSRLTPESLQQKLKW